MGKHFKVLQRRFGVLVAFIVTVRWWQCYWVLLVTSVTNSVSLLVFQFSVTVMVLVLLYKATGANSFVLPA